MAGAEYFFRFRVSLDSVTTRVVVTEEKPFLTHQPTSRKRPSSIIEQEEPNFIFVYKM